MNIVGVLGATTDVLDCTALLLEAVPTTHWGILPDSMVNEPAGPILPNIYPALAVMRQTGPNVPSLA